MKLFIWGWLVALSSSLIWPKVPPYWITFILLTIAIIVLYFRHYFIAGICLAICYFSWQAAAYQNAVQQLAKSPYNHTIDGRISAVSNDPYRRKIILQITHLNGADNHLVRAKFVRLNQYWNGSKPDDLSLFPGDFIQVRAKLKPAHSSLNEGGFNYQRYLVSHQIIAQGTIRHLTLMSRGSSLRAHIVNQLEPYWQDLSQRGIIEALVFGHRSNIPSIERDLWMHSGIGHLLAISGLHLGILSFWGYLIGAMLACGRSRIKRYLAPTCALIFAFSYGVLANWPASAQRAMMMLLIWWGLRALHLNFTRLEVWLIAAFILTALWPLSILNTGLWLSFFAMLSLIMLLWFPVKSRVVRMILLQVGLLILLMPLQILLFGYLPLWSVFLNLLFIPYFSFVVVPCLFISCLSGLLGYSDLAHLGFNVVNYFIAYVERILITLSHHLPLFIQVPHHIWFIVLFIGLVFMAGWMVRKPWLSAVAFMSGLLAIVLPWAKAIWRIDFLDVGQGLAVVVEQGQDAIIYDTANRYPTGFSYAQAVIIPFLNERNLSVDEIVVSHADQDHFGGYPILHRYYPHADSVFGADPRFKQHNCRGVKQWHKLTLQYIQPPATLKPVNNLSCMVLVSDGIHRVLLTGDIEQKAEEWWVQKFHNKVDVISVPHHGSNSSSSLKWLKDVHPHWAIISSGFHNSYHFPRTQVVSRYQKEHTVLLNTAKLGQISMSFTRTHEKILSYRNNIAPFWYNRLLITNNGW
ncbi:DNA internalization-related competence protein ComEC/Rec2 [Celerinatantimonas diazotrophica]|uniref:Competence protein ComEC n=1 Tax=Celerinatantimonas diazotrophica TaxID=412034 RepID=A0A4R1J922_9GAMM|nr:DNA internalization-related competence protein ComEC/Rec2 [Celerinatantimonas diazotrophica]TCK46575.1 competence protein ComEC [Celerinatantimonas diazotrophica]CAG9296625.1 ComE operon protein 3 [Celerinatantimonas diazotrophica]